MQIEREDLLSYYKGKKVLVTGHTGFKGSWLSLMLQMAGAEVIGYALEPNTEPALFELAGISDGMTSVIGDIRDLEHLQKVFERYQPEYVFHLAAQPIVRESYRNPVDTYSTNVMGTVNVLECVRHCDSVRSVLNVTTDKVYLNQEQEHGYQEEDQLDGYDPYSNSKSCSEIVTHSYTKSFLADRGVRVSTARAGNVIGGGDFEKDRILPDCVRAALAGEQVIVRNPDSVRPYQHVLESLYVYLMIAASQHEDAEVQGAYNVGPDEADCWTTQKLVDYFCTIWGNGLTWRVIEDNSVHEASLLKLNCEKLKEIFSWKPQWGIRIAVDKVAEWTRVYLKKGDIRACMEQQIREYISKESCEKKTRDKGLQKRPKISVIMLTYNREQLVSRAIESVLEQSFTDFEFIIVDNGSTDRSVQIAKQYAAQDARIRLVSIPKHTIGYGRNRGLDEARGEYITFIDDDDIAYPDMLDFLYGLVVENDADIALCGSEKEADGKVYPNCVFEEKQVMDSEEAVVTLLKRKKYNAAMPTKLLRKELFDKIRFLEDGTYDDISVVYRYFAEAKKTVAWGVPKYCFYRHPGNNSAFTTNDLLLTPKQLDEYLAAFRERTDYLSKRLPNIADYAQYSEWSYMISMVNKITKNGLKQCHSQLEQMRQELATHYDAFYGSPYIEEFEKEWMRKYLGESKAKEL